MKSYLAKSRLVPLVLIFGMILLIFCGVLYNTQILNGSDYKARSLASNATAQTVEASRGIVTDRNGKPWSATTPTLTAVQAPVTAIDLSRDGTANCYIVSEAGEYMFDATVRGNGSGDDAAIALADGMKADWLWVTKGLEQEISEIGRASCRERV